jgi:hypothetical protein
MSAPADIMAVLRALRDAFAALPSVKTCAIGLEADMTPDDYPMVRLVPSSARWGLTIDRRECDVLVYFGQPIHEFEGGMEALYESLFALERALLEASQTTAGVFAQYRETIIDEDRIDAYKLMALRLTVEG